MAPLLIALALLGPGHSRSEGKSSFRLHDDGRVAITVQLADLDLPELCNVDFSVADRIGEEAKLSRCLESGLARWLRVSADGRACPIAYGRWTARERTVAIEAQAQCEGRPGTLTVDWGLFAGGALDHVSVAMFEQPHAKPRVVMLSKRSSRAVIDVAGPLWPWLVAGAGMAALLAAGAGLWWRRRSRARGPVRG